MSGSPINREVKHTDPIEDQNIRRLAAKIRDKAKARGKLDELLIFRHQGAAGMVETGEGWELPANASEEDCIEAATRLLSMVDEHAEREGSVLYQIRGFGETNKGQATEKMRFAYRPGSDDEENETEAGSEMMDVIKASRVANESMAKSVAALTDMNEAIAKNFGAMCEQVVGMLDVAAKQGMTMVEARKVEIEAEKWRMEKEFDARDADREAEISKERMRHGVGVLGMVADGFMAHKNAEAHKQAAEAGTTARDVQRGDAARMGLDQIFQSLNDDEKAEAKDAVGENLWDLFTAAVANENADERKAILRQIALVFQAMPDRQQRGEALAAAIGQSRATSLMMLVQAAVLG